MALGREPLLSRALCPRSLPLALQLLSPSYSAPPAISLRLLLFDNDSSSGLPFLLPPPHQQCFPFLHSSFLILLLFWNLLLCTMPQASKAFPKLSVTSLANCSLHLSSGQLCGRGGWDLVEDIQICCSLITSAGAAILCWERWGNYCPFAALMYRLLQLLELRGHFRVSWQHFSGSAN